MDFLMDSDQIATNNRTLGVQNDTRAHSSSNSNANISIAIGKGTIIVKSGVIRGQAACISKNSDDTYG